MLLHFINYYIIVMVLLAFSLAEIRQKRFPETVDAFFDTGSLDNVPESFENIPYSPLLSDSGVLEERKLFVKREVSSTEKERPKESKSIHEEDDENEDLNQISNEEVFKFGMDKLYENTPEVNDQINEKISSLDEDLAELHNLVQIMSAVKSKGVRRRRLQKRHRPHEDPNDCNEVPKTTPLAEDFLYGPKDLPHDPDFFHAKSEVSPKKSRSLRNLADKEFSFHPHHNIRRVTSRAPYTVKGSLDPSYGDGGESLISIPSNGVVEESYVLSNSELAKEQKSLHNRVEELDTIEKQLEKEVIPGTATFEPQSTLETLQITPSPPPPSPPTTVKQIQLIQIQNPPPSDNTNKNSPADENAENLSEDEINDNSENTASNILKAFQILQQKAQLPKPAKDILYPMHKTIRRMKKRDAAFEDAPSRFLYRRPKYFKTKKNFLHFRHEPPKFPVNNIVLYLNNEPYYFKKAPRPIEKKYKKACVPAKDVEPVPKKNVIEELTTINYDKAKEENMEQMMEQSAPCDALQPTPVLDLDKWNSKDKSLLFPFARRVKEAPEPTSSTTEGGSLIINGAPAQDSYSQTTQQMYSTTPEDGAPDDTPHSEEAPQYDPPSAHSVSNCPTARTHHNTTVENKPVKHRLDKYNNTEQPMEMQTEATASGQRGDTKTMAQIESPEHHEEKPEHDEEKETSEDDEEDHGEEKSDHELIEDSKEEAETKEHHEKTQEHHGEGKEEHNGEESKEHHGEKTEEHHGEEKEHHDEKSEHEKEKSDHHEVETKEHHGGEKSEHHGGETKEEKNHDEKSAHEGEAKEHHGEEKSEHHGEETKEHHGEEKSEHHGEETKEHHGEEKSEHHGEETKEHHGEEKSEHHGEKTEEHNEETKEHHGDEKESPDTSTELGTLESTKIEEQTSENDLLQVSTPHHVEDSEHENKNTNPPTEMLTTPVGAPSSEEIPFGVTESQLPMSTSASMEKSEEGTTCSPEQLAEMAEIEKNKANGTNIATNVTNTATNVTNTATNVTSISKNVQGTTAQNGTSNISTPGDSSKAVGMTQEELYAEIPINNKNMELSTNCTNADYMAKNHCICSVTAMKKDLMDDIKDISTSSTYQYDCSKFIRIEPGIVIGNGSESKLVRKKRDPMDIFFESITLKEGARIGRDIESFLHQDVEVHNNGTLTYATVGSKITIPCGDVIQEDTTSMLFEWTVHNGAPETAGNKPNNGSTLVIENVVPQDTNNYTCKATDTSSHIVQSYTHELIVVALPMFSIMVTVLLKEEDKCNPGDLEVLNLYYSVALKNILCGSGDDICSVSIERPQCVKVGSQEVVSIRSTLQTVLIATMFPKLKLDTCDLSCQGRLYSAMAGVLLKNFASATNLAVLFRLSYRDTTLKPIQNELGDKKNTISNSILPICPPGFGIYTNAKLCFACNAYSYNPGNEMKCIACPTGSYQPSIGEGSCLPCNSPIDDTSCFLPDGIADMTRKYYLFPLIACACILLLICSCLCANFAKKQKNKTIVKLTKKISKLGQKQPNGKESAKKVPEKSSEKSLKSVKTESTEVSVKKETKKGKKIPPELPPIDF